MNLYIENRGSWLFSNQKYDYDFPYIGIELTLKVLLTELMESKILIPRMLEDGKKLNYSNVDELVDIILEYIFSSKVSEIDIYGDTIIYTSKGYFSHPDIFSIQGFRTTMKNFSLDIYSDVFLPMILNYEDFSYSWNLECYNLNYHRLPSLLKKISEILPWKNKSLLDDDQTNWAYQSGLDLFICKDVILQEYEKNPNPNFDIEGYIKKQTKM